MGKRLKYWLTSILGPFLALILVGSQFPVSPHAYTSVLSADQHSSGMMCKMDGSCMATASGHCCCKSANADNPFYCSCDTAGKQLMGTIQLSKVLLSEHPDIRINFSSFHILEQNLLSEPRIDTDDIFHPPQWA